MIGCSENYSLFETRESPEIIWWKYVGRGLKRPPVNNDIIYEYNEFTIVGKKDVVAWYQWTLEIVQEKYKWHPLRLFNDESADWRCL